MDSIPHAAAEYKSMLPSISFSNAFFIVFKYIPMTYIQIAFKEYNITKSVWEMDWSDPLFKYFGKAFSNRDFLYALRNTIFLNLLDLAVGFPDPSYWRLF